jgi:hypothetical protein
LSRLSGRAAVESALAAVGGRLAHANAPCSIVVVGGAALNLAGMLDRPTIDVDVLARVADVDGTIQPPEPLPASLRRAIAAVARDLGLAEDWMNTAVADQWQFGLPPGLSERLEWRSFGALRVGIAHRRDLICFKLYASADQTGPDNVHVRDLIALQPDAEELEWAAEWVRSQDPSPAFQTVLDRVVSYVADALR